MVFDLTWDAKTYSQRKWEKKKKKHHQQQLKAWIPQMRITRIRAPPET